MQETEKFIAAAAQHSLSVGKRHYKFRSAKESGCKVALMLLSEYDRKKAEGFAKIPEKTYERFWEPEEGKGNGYNKQYMFGI